jgi:hypothetical protein
MPRSQHDANHAGEALFPTLVITMPMTRSSVLFQFDQGSDRSPRAGIEPRETKLDKLPSAARTSAACTTGSMIC